MVGKVAILGVNTRDLIVMGVNEKQIGDEELGRFIVKDARLHVGFVIRKQNRVKLKARTVTRVNAGSAVKEADPLTRLVEGLGLAKTNPFANRKHSFEACFDLGAILCGDHLTDLLNMSVHEIHDSANAFFLGIVEILLVGVDLAILFYFVKKSAESKTETDAIVASKVSIAVDTRLNVVLFLQGLEVVVGEALFVPALAPLRRHAAARNEIAKLFVLLDPIGHIMHVTAVVDQHIPPSAAKHFHRIHVGGMRRKHAAEILAHTVKPVEASVFAIVPRLGIIALGQRNGTEIVKVGVAVLFPFGKGMGDLGAPHGVQSILISQHTF